MNVCDTVLPHAYEAICFLLAFPSMVCVSTFLCLWSIIDSQQLCLTILFNSTGVLSMWHKVCTCTVCHFIGCRLFFSLLCISQRLLGLWCMTVHEWLLVLCNYYVMMILSLSLSLCLTVVSKHYWHRHRIETSLGLGLGVCVFCVSLRLLFDSFVILNEA